MGQTPEEIEKEIAETREALADKVDALAGQVKDGVDQVKDGIEVARSKGLKAVGAAFAALTLILGVKRWRGRR